MAGEKQQNTMKDLDQSMIDLGVRLCEDFTQGKVINDAQSKLLDAVTKLYSVVKTNEQPANNSINNKSISKQMNK